METLSRFFVSERLLLEPQLHRQLKLSRISDTLPQEAVEVEQARGRQGILIPGAGERVDKVVVVECIEHLDLRDQLDCLGETDRTSEPPIE